MSEKVRWRGSRVWSIALAAACIAVTFGVLPVVSHAGEVGVGAYCDTWVPSNTDCANITGGQWSNGLFDKNAGEVPGGEVCEHTYIQGTGTTVSRTCSKGFTASGLDLDCYYVSGTHLSGHVGAGSGGGETYGETWRVTPKCT